LAQVSLSVTESLEHRPGGIVGALLAVLDVPLTITSLACPIWV
jgi:hypothetical protein